jgi:hypothetical protein
MPIGVAAEAAALAALAQLLVRRLEMVELELLIQ